MSVDPRRCPISSGRSAIIGCDVVSLHLARRRAGAADPCTDCARISPCRSPFSPRRPGVADPRPIVAAASSASPVAASAADCRGHRHPLLAGLFGMLAGARGGAPAGVSVDDRVPSIDLGRDPAPRSGTFLHPFLVSRIRRNRKAGPKWLLTAPALHAVVANISCRHRRSPWCSGPTATDGAPDPREASPPQR